MNGWGIKIFPTHQKFFYGSIIMSLTKKFTWKDYALVMGVWMVIVLFGLFLRGCIIWDYLYERIKLKK
jgi:hypothetical protein